MRYMKIHGAGNDFIIINNYDGGISPEQYSALAMQLCQRRLSIGADGLMIVEKLRLTAILKWHSIIRTAAEERCAGTAQDVYPDTVMSTGLQRATYYQLKQTQVLSRGNVCRSVFIRFDWRIRL